MSEGSSRTFALVHGAWHGAWCWEYLRPYLEEAGHKTVAMDLPIEDTGANFEDYASTVIESLQDLENITLVVHSRAGNVGPRVAHRLKTIDRLVYLCAPVPTFADMSEDVMPQAPKRNSEEFLNGIVTQANGLTHFNPVAAPNVFYSECDPQKAAWAAGQLRQQQRYPSHVDIITKPDVPTTYIYTRGDRVINQDYSRFVAEQVLDVEPIEMPGDHSPFLSRPKELADILLSL